MEERPCELYMNFRMQFDTFITILWVFYEKARFLHRFSNVVNALQVF